MTPAAGRPRYHATIEACDEAPGLPSLDPGTRLKTHVLTVEDDSGRVLWRKSFYCHYANHQTCLTGEALFVGYDDKVVVVDPGTGDELTNFVMYLFEGFEPIGADRVLVTEKGALYLLDARGRRIWQFGGTEILDAVGLHSSEHLFVHYWEGVDLEGLKVPFAPLNLVTGVLDVAGPPEGPFAFDEFVDPGFVGGPIDETQRRTLIENLRELGRRHPGVAWIRAALEYLG